ncbi:hypothetical protein ABN125_04815 [Proteus terrae]|uniref:hypothetical protein n=1 Tax=Proteus terrae TaxID=1574161 RepID=UPI0032DA4001
MVTSRSKQAKAYNFQFLTLLDEKELLSVAKSIAKWTHSKFSEESFIDFVIKTHAKEIQSIRGSSGGKKVKVVVEKSCLHRKGN